MCFAQCHLKRLLAFSTVSHTGLFLVGAGLLTPRGLAGAALYIVSHGMVKGGLFLAAGILLNRFASVDTNELRGRGRIFPWLGAVFLAGGLGLSGLPPFGTFLGKSLIEGAANEAGYVWVPALLLVCSALTGGAVLRAAGEVFLGWGPMWQAGGDAPTHEEKETKEDYDRPPLVMLGPAAVLTLLALLPGLWPWVERPVRAAAARFEDPSGYYREVIEGRPAPLAVGPSESLLPGVLYGVGAAAAAAGLAFLALFPRMVPRQARKAAQALTRPPLAALRALHSGHVGDYVAWIVAGVALLGGLCALLFSA